MVYEIEKGVRPLALYTMPKSIWSVAQSKLTNRSIAHYVQPVPNNNDTINLFFGDENCINAIIRILKGRTLDELNAEEDFMLGAMLGYDICKQCKRFCQIKAGKEAKKERVVG